jgi:uncharacterized membrane protein YdjX (TVP38/TMEM64 family)
MRQSGQGETVRYWRVIGLAAAVLVLAVVVAAVDLPDPEQVRGWVGGGGLWSSLVFFLLCAAGTAAFFPKPVLATASGLLFGILPGLAIAVAGFTAGAMVSFSIARLAGRPRVAGRLGAGRLLVLDSVFARNGLAATVVLRLLPVIPFTVSNYGAGVTAVTPGSFAVGTALGLVPTTALAVTLGDAVLDLDSPRSIAAATAWLVLAAVGVGWGGRLLRQAHRQVSTVPEK